MRFKPVAVICMDTGTRYASISEASKEFGIRRYYISRCCKGVYRQAGGHEWCYAEGQLRDTTVTIDKSVSGVELLARQIVIQALTDYRTAQARGDQKMMEQIESDLRSDYFAKLFDVDADLLLSSVKKVSE